MQQITSLKNSILAKQQLRLLLNLNQKNDKVILVGFGTFSVTKRAARKGRNPQTGKEINIPAKKVVKFKAGTNLQAKVK